MCFRCGLPGHTARDRNCPAINRKCDRCGKLGHYRKCCKTQLADNQSERGRFNGRGRFSGRSGRSGRVNNVRDSVRKEYTDNFDYQSEEECSKEYTFVLGSRSEKETLSLNDIDVQFITDAGASVNMTDKELWEQLNIRKIKCKTQKTDKRLYPYGTDKLLKLLGKFTVDGTVKNTHGKYITMDIYVMDGKGPALLGKESAEQLGLLKVGVNVIQDDILSKYDSCFKGVGRLKVFKLKLSIDDTVKPVAQKMYRI